MKRWLLVAALAGMPVAAMAAPKAGSIEARLQRVEDELALRRIPIEYARALDERNYDAYVGLFAKNGEWINGKTVKKGPEEIRQLLVGIFGDPKPGFVNMQSMEVVSNIDVTVDGDHATGTCLHVLLRRASDGTPAPALTGRYEDEYIRENGEWRILRRVDKPIMPTPEEWAKKMAAEKSQPKSGAQ